MSFKALKCTVYHMQSLLLPSFISVPVVCVKIFQKQRRLDLQSDSEVYLHGL